MAGEPRSSLKTAATAALNGVLLFVAQSCGPDIPTEATPQTFGELQLIVTSVLGAGIDPHRVSVGFDAVVREDGVRDVSFTIRCAAPTEHLLR